MEVEFEKEYLQELYTHGKCKDKHHRYQPQVVRGYLKCVRALMAAQRMEDLFTYRSLNYEHLHGDEEGLSSLRINDQYRMEFREIRNSKSIIDVEICRIVDITNHYK